MQSRPTSAASRSRSIGRRTKKRSHKLDDFMLGSQLGTGKFGKVYVAKEKETGKLVAIKVMYKDELKRNNVVNQVRREVEIHARLRHENIIRFYSHFMDDERVFLVMELANGRDLYHVMHASEEKCFSESRTANYIMQLARVLHYLHQRYVIHRDIKPENILLTVDNTDPENPQEVVKLADFGWAVVSKHDDVRTTFCGTTDYLSPEMIGVYRQEEGSTEYGEMVDVWTLGVLTYEFLTGHAPFSGEDILADIDKDEEQCNEGAHLEAKREEGDVDMGEDGTRSGSGKSQEEEEEEEGVNVEKVYENIVRGKLNFPSHLSENAKSFISKVLHPDPNKRLRLSAVMGHPWITQFFPNASSEATAMAEAERRRAVKDAQALRVRGKAPPPGHPATAIFADNANAAKRRSRSRGATARGHSALRGKSKDRSAGSRSSSQVRHRSVSRSATHRSRSRPPGPAHSASAKEGPPTAAFGATAPAPSAGASGISSGSVTDASMEDSQGRCDSSGVPASQQTFMQRQLEAYQRWLQRRGMTLDTRERRPQQTARTRTQTHRPQSRARSIERSKAVNARRSKSRGPPKAKITGDAKVFHPTPKSAWDGNAHASGSGTSSMLKASVAAAVQKMTAVHMGKATETSSVQSNSTKWAAPRGPAMM